MQFCHRGKNEINEKSDGNSHENTCCKNIELQLKELCLFWKHYEVMVTLLLPALAWPGLEHSEQFGAPQFQSMGSSWAAEEVARLPAMSCQESLEDVLSPLLALEAGTRFL